MEWAPIETFSSINNKYFFKTYMQHVICCVFYNVNYLLVILKLALIDFQILSITTRIYFYFIALASTLLFHFMLVC